MVAILAPAIFSTFWLNSILTQGLILGIGAASLIFLSAYGGMISLAQTGLMGIAGYALANMVTQRVPGGETKGLLLGWDPTLALIGAVLLTVGIGLVFGAVASRSYGIYFLMLTLTYTVIAFLFVGVRHPHRRLLAGHPRRPVHAGLHREHRQGRQRLYYIALIAAVFVYLPDPVRRPNAVRDLLPGGSRRAPRMARSATTSPCTGRGVRDRRVHCRDRRRAVRLVVWSAVADDDGSRCTIQLLIIAVLGGLRRIEGAWIGALAFLRDQQHRHQSHPIVGLPVIGGTFNTVIGFIFLAIVIVSPDGLMGLWDRIWDAARRRGGPPRRGRWRGDRGGDFV